MPSQPPEYQCHKTVKAWKIHKIDIDNGEVTITPVGGEPFKVDAGYYLKHSPEEGGYWVKYEDGYQSFSPADVFEKSYALTIQKAACSSGRCCR